MSKAIRVEGLGKRYRIGVASDRPDTLPHAVLHALSSPWRNLSRLRRLSRFEDGDGDIVWALRDVSFDVEEGEVLGIIGRNGAGKSTLLKILSRIALPTTGRAIVRGKVGSLLEVGTGFHPELTGRDNVYLNGAILGMDRSYIDRHFDAIVEFAGVAKFIDTPVKRYSSGMSVRLAFAVAAHLQPEVLIIDEVLSVGDAEFQKRCLGKMEDVAQSGRTVLFVSHNMHAVRALCTRCLWIDGGGIRVDSDPPSTIDAYLGVFRDIASSGSMELADWPERSGSGQVRILRARMLDEEGRISATATRGRRLAVEYDIESDYSDSLTFTAIVNSEAGTRVLNLAHHDSPDPVNRRVTGPGVVRFDVDSLPLAAGTYTLTLGVLTDQMHPLDVVWNVLSFAVNDDPETPRPFETSAEWGLCWTPNRWKVEQR